MNPSFNFVLGRPVGNGFGRWVEGSVVSGAQTYEFTANLWFQGPGASGCHRVRLMIDRPFAAYDFAAYLRVVSTGRFATANRILGLYEAAFLDPAGASAIFEASAPWIDPWEHESLELLGELASLGDQLAEVTKKELIGLAVARFSGGRDARGGPGPSSPCDEPM